MLEDELLIINEAARMLGVSVDTLRRWDKSGKLRPVKISNAGYRLYSKSQIDLHGNDLFSVAHDWAVNGGEIPPKFHCSNSAVFQIRLAEMQRLFSGIAELENLFHLMVAVTGEIGNNSFDHNLGNWPDMPGIFFGYDAHKKTIVVADRGVGILSTLKRVRPELHDHAGALRVAFTEVVSGRAPENRGNGLKFVRKVVAENPIGLLFWTGDAELALNKDSDILHIERSSQAVRGCIALITF